MTGTSAMKELRGTVVKNIKIFHIKVNQPYSCFMSQSPFLFVIKNVGNVDICMRIYYDFGKPPTFQLKRTSGITIILKLNSYAKETEASHVI